MTRVRKAEEEAIIADKLTGAPKVEESKFKSNLEEAF